ncbi:MAG TPA: ATP-binding protein [Pyrinomonadaceae bacterium]|jgi:signal transduction histidine kinase/ActR/RegA family two-component response regulator
MGQDRFISHFFWSIISLGAVVCLFVAYHFSPANLDLRFIVLSLVTTALTSRLIIRIPRLTSHISVSDTLIFLTILLYGGEAAVLLAAAEAVTSSLLFTKEIRIVLFNTAVAVISTFLTASALEFCFGSINRLSEGRFSIQFITALGLMGLVQYGSNSGIISVATALRRRRPIWEIWRQHYVWPSMTFLAGASAAGITAKLIVQVGFAAVIVISPIIAIVFLTYRTYLNSIEASVKQAEQARQHVEELSHYIAEQERIREQFGQIEKLSALGELSSGVAHDLNNTLAGILARAQLLQRTQDPEKLRRGLDIIIRTAEDGAKTVKRIQDFARQRRDQDFAPVSVDQLLADVAEMTRPRWKDQAEAANIYIQLEMQNQSNALVMGEDCELRDVLVNMVFNAVDAMPAGGTLRLAAEERDGHVELTVSDTGAGMSQEVRSRVFDPFFTTKGKAGMGLGLAVSFGIIRRHEGTIEIESEVGRGSTFRIRLPLARCVQQPASQTSPLVSLPPLNTETGPAIRPSSPTELARILIVDDEAYVCEILRDILLSEGCEVATANGGHEGLATFEAGAFDAVFTDLGMPEMCGWELARAIRERDQEIPIAVITGWGEAVGSDKQRAAQVDWVVAKPFHAERIAILSQEIQRRKSQASDAARMTRAA